MINDALESPGHIQKIYTTSRIITIQVRVKGKTLIVAIGRGGGYEGIFLGESHPKSFLRKKDKWLDWMRKHVSGSLLLKLEMDDLDRAVGIKIQKAGANECVRIAWIGRDTYFSHEARGLTIFSSWGKADSSVTGFNVFNSIGRKSVESNQEIRLMSLDKLYTQEEASASVHKNQKNRKLKIKNKISKIRDDLDKISNWKSIKEWIEKNDITMLEKSSEISFGRLRIKFPQHISIYQKRDILFKKIKTLREIELKQLARLQVEVEDLEVSVTLAKEVNELKVIQPVWKKEAIFQDVESKNVGYKVIKKDGYSIAWGQSAQGNDRLRKEWAHPSDVWVHLSQVKSAHAVIKLNPNIIFNHAMLKEAAILISKQSGSSDVLVEIIFTQVKYLKGVSGSPGMVMFKKEKRLTVDMSEPINE